MRWGVRVNVGRTSRPVYQKSGEFKIKNKTKKDPSRKKEIGKQFTKEFLVAFGLLGAAVLAEGAILRKMGR